MICKYGAADHYKDLNWKIEGWHRVVKQNTGKRRSEIFGEGVYHSWIVTGWIRNRLCKHKE